MQISRLYRPLDTATPFSDDEDEGGTQLLPTHKKSTLRGQKSLQLADPWDEHEELFGVGDDSDQDEAESPTQSQQASDGRQVTNV